MTDLMLQKALVEEVEALCEKENISKPGETGWIDWHIYTQDKPYKDDYNDNVEEDYIIVMLDDEDTNSDGDWIVDVHFLVSIQLFEQEHQGNLIIADMMNRLYMHFMKKGLVDNRYELQLPAAKRFNQEHFPNYYEGDLITKWKIPSPLTEGLEDYI